MNPVDRSWTTGTVPTQRIKKIIILKASIRLQTQHSDKSLCMTPGNDGNETETDCEIILPPDTYTDKVDERSAVDEVVDFVHSKNFL